MLVKTVLGSAVAVFVLSACTTSSGESPSFLQSLQQGVGALAMGVGVASGNTRLATQGAETLGSGLGSEPGGSSGTQVAQGSGGSASSGDCLQYLRRQRLQALQNAQQCKVNANHMASLGAEREADIQCGGTKEYIDQRVAHEACGRVYTCAANAYLVAYREAQAGAECQPAMQRGLARWPIPR